MNPVTITAPEGQSWTQGVYEVWHLRGGCRIAQGQAEAKSDEMLLWIERQDVQSQEPDKIIAYLEGAAEVYMPRAAAADGTAGQPANSRDTLRDRAWVGRFYTFEPIKVQVGKVAPADAPKSDIYRRAMLAHIGQPEKVRPAQFQPPVGAAPLAPPAAPLPGPIGPEAIPPGAPVAVPTPGQRRIFAQPRSPGVRVQAKSFPSADGREQIVVVDSGVNIVITGLDQLGTVEIATDRLVLWTTSLDQLDLSGQGGQRQDTPLELYLEGNIVFRQGERVVYAKSMYYNVAAERGTVLQAEMLTPAPGYRGLVRLKADVIEQLNRQQFVAGGAAVTTSRLGVPRYWFQSERIEIEDVQRPLVNPFNGQVQIDPQSGNVAIDHQVLATSRNNFVYFGGAPVFYWPTIATDLTEPGIYLQNIRLKNDSIFGTAIYADWDLYQLLGMRDHIQGTTWELSTDYLSERGFALGTDFDYDRVDAFGFPAPARGTVDAWGIYDTGLDTLGRDRNGITFPDPWRGRLLWRHQQEFASGMKFNGELGLISDKNFLEQYFETEWDQLKDQTTGLQLTQPIGNLSWSIEADARLNDFFTQTEWLPRADLFWLGQPLGGFVFHSHSHVGYAKIRTAEPSPDPADPSVPLDWETDSGGVPYAEREGIRAGTRNEIDYPIDVGPFKFVPYALGDVTTWGEDVDGDSYTRFYGQAGLRGSIPWWSVDPTVRSELWNLNGMAHKVVLDADIFYADASRNLGDLPLYDPVDDDSQEAFRRRFFIPDGTFFGVPAGTFARFDERFYAVRTGMQGAVVPGSIEIAEDLMMAKLGLKQRWQTKRGPAGAERIIDWITLDVEGSLFGDAGRDNFGAVLGQLQYDFTWHIGDRVTLISDGYTDFFDEALRTIQAGIILGRPEQGDFYLGFRSIEGPISANVLTAAFNYRLSEKWIASLGTSVDFSSTGNIGQRVAITRVGESFLATLGFNVDSGRENVGVTFLLEPRFLGHSRRARLGGVYIPPAGVRGLE